VIGTFRVGKYAVLYITAEKKQEGYHFSFYLEGYFTEDYGEAEVLKNQVLADKFMWISAAGESYPVPSNVIKYFINVADKLG
jgi:hypothetical protein